MSLRKYIEDLPKENQKIYQIEVTLVTGERKKLLELNGWEIMNISNEETMKLYDLGFNILYGTETSKQKNFENFSAYQKGVSEYSVGRLGLIDMYYFLEEINEKNPVPEWGKHPPRPKIFIPATAHYSIPKSLSILGLGTKGIEKVIVDLDARVSISALKQHLQECLTKKIPVLGVAGVVGATEESSIDDLIGILELKEEFLAQGLYFHFHVDGAYGGYFVCMTRDRQPEHMNSYSSYVDRQLAAISKADSITFDPHKTGYVPYTCGGIIYRNHRLRDNLSFSAPYMYNEAEPNMAIYGVEGSKPGSSATSVYLSLQVLPLVRGGHGELLERALMNAKIFTASLYRIKEIDIEYEYGKGTKLNERFNCLLLPRLYC